MPGNGIAASGGIALAVPALVPISCAQERPRFRPVPPPALFSTSGGRTGLHGLAPRVDGLPGGWKVELMQQYPPSPHHPGRRRRQSQRKVPMPVVASTAAISAILTRVKPAATHASGEGAPA